MEKPKILTSETLFNGFFNVQQDLLERSNGKRLPYSHCVFPTDAAVILAETANGKFIINREYRHPTKNYVLGCPGGSLLENEDPLVGGAREFTEETGYVSNEIELLGVAYPMPSICNQKIYFVWAKNAHEKGKQHLDPFEYIQVELKTEREIHEEMLNGAILDGLLLTALSFRRWKTQNPCLV